MLPANMNEHYSCGVEAARCYFGDKVVSENELCLKFRMQSKFQICF